jgi:6-phosphogluconolactonase
LCFDPAGRYGYLINELDNTIVSFRREGSTDLEEVATFSTLPDDFAGTSYCAHVQVSADGRYLYASNRGHDSIAVFEVAGDGGLRLVQLQPSGGGHPRHFALSPDESRLLVANRDAGNIVVFDRDPDSGRLAETGREIAVPAPVCILFRG